MVWRLSLEKRCSDCFLRKPLCVCGLSPRLKLATRVTVLLHKRERYRTSNTGRLAVLALDNAGLFVRGLPGVRLDPFQIAPEGYQSIFLYPSDDAQPLTPEVVQLLKKPVNIIVPDGNWRQASKVINREEKLSDLPKVKIPAGAPTEYFLRREVKDGGLATFEAIARAVGAFEGREAQEKMERFFHIMVERLLWGRGKKLAEDCIEEIPRNAKN